MLLLCRDKETKRTSKKINLGVILMNKAVYTPPLLRMGGQERNGEKTLPFCFGHRLTNQPTDRPTNRPTDTAWSRVASPRLKIETLLVDIM